MTTIEYAITEWFWTMRLRLAHWLVGDRTFVANVDVVGILITRKWTFGVPVAKDIGIFTDDAEYWGTKQ